MSHTVVDIAQPIPCWHCEGKMYHREFFSCFGEHLQFFECSNEMCRFTLDFDFVKVYGAKRPSGTAA